jgi:hypothetical protein
MQTTLYPKTRRAADPRPLKPGKNNMKLGWIVRKGPLKGARIFALALEERATCPASCGLWQRCYGNHMPFAARQVVNEHLLLTINAQLDELCARYPKVLVRLHVLGDFPSVAYVEFWDAQLFAHPNLYIWGYTHHLPDSPIGQAIARLCAHPRCRILHSQEVLE